MSRSPTFLPLVAGAHGGRAIAPTTHPSPNLGRVDKREQVFVSSTYVDLIGERQAVIQTLLEADCIPTGMELFPAYNDERWALIKRVIDACDYYIVIVGGRYGSTDDAGISYTEREFDYAESAGIPILGFVHSDPGAIAAAKSELREEAQAKLTAFKTKVQRRMCKSWRTGDELGAQVAKSLIQVRKTHPAEGWVRARDALTPEARAETAELKQRVAVLEHELAEARAAPLAGSEDLAQGRDAVKLDFDTDFWNPEDQARYGWPGQAKSTWDDLFRDIAPSMLDECTQTQFNSAIARHVKAIAESMRGRVQGVPDDASLQNFKGSSQSLDGVLVQFIGLGLIERGVKRRGVADHHTYWKLTKRGEEHLMNLRTVRRPRRKAAKRRSPRAGDSGKR